jgi:hypothetical protein
MVLDSMILFVTRTVIDFGQDTLYDGLCRVLGENNVIEYPHRPTLHGARGGRYGQYPCMFDYKAQMTDAEKIELLKSGGFERIFVACTSTRDFTREQDGNTYNYFNGILEEASKKTPVYLIDMGDTKGTNESLRRKLDAKLYFKREYAGNLDFQAIPFNFSYSESYIPNIDTKRDIPLFWAGKFAHYRRRFLEVANEVLGIDMSNYGFSQDDYKEQLLRSKIGLSLRGYGFDTVRYYEVPAHGALLFSQKPKIRIENDFIDGENAVFFYEPEDMREKLKYLLEHDDYVDSIRLKGHEWLKKYHTSEVRARQLLEYI